MTIENLDDLVQREIMPRLMELRRYFHPELLEAEDAADVEKQMKDDKPPQEVF